MNVAMNKKERMKNSSSPLKPSVIKIKNITSQNIPHSELNSGYAVFHLQGSASIGLSP